jgi:hypothetical protein
MSALRHLVLLLLVTPVGLALTFTSGVPAANAQSAAPAASLLEPPRHRQGYYLQLGLYSLVNQTWDDGESLGTWNGSAFSLRLGQMVTRRFGLGLQIDSGLAKKDTRSANIAGISLAAQLEIVRNLAVHGGSGLGVLSLSDSTTPDADLEGTVGAGFFFGVSYDWFPWKKRLSGGFALTPTAQVRFIPTDTYDVFTAMLGLNFTWWTGLPANQLELPESEAYKKR